MQKFNYFIFSLGGQERLIFDVGGTCDTSKKPDDAGTAPAEGDKKDDSKDKKEDAETKEKAEKPSGAQLRNALAAQAKRTVASLEELAKDVQKPKEVIDKATQLAKEIKDAHAAWFKAETAEHAKIQNNTDALKTALVKGQAHLQMSAEVKKSASEEYWDRELDKTYNTKEETAKAAIASVEDTINKYKDKPYFSKLDGTYSSQIIQYSKAPDNYQAVLNRCKELIVKINKAAAEMENKEPEKDKDLQAFETRKNEADNKVNEIFTAVGLEAGMFESDSGLPSSEGDVSWDQALSFAAAKEIVKAAYIDKGEATARATAQQLKIKYDSAKGVFGEITGADMDTDELREIFPGVDKALNVKLVKNPAYANATGRIWGYFDMAQTELPSDQQQEYTTYLREWSDKNLGTGKSDINAAEILDGNFDEKKLNTLMSPTEWKKQREKEEKNKKSPSLAA